MTGRDGDHWTPLGITREAAGYLEQKGVEEPRLDAELLLAHVLGVRRLDLYLQFERPLTPAEVAAYRETIRRRALREPLQYIEGTASFRELELAVDRRVLIPRPETEVLVSLVLERLGGSDRAVLEWGVGSGAIALSLAVEGGARVVAADRSRAALQVGRRNVEAVLGGYVGAGEVKLVAADLYTSPFAAALDAVVSNPPYVQTSEWDTLEAEVREWEPRSALVSGPKGIEPHEAILRDATRSLRPGGFVALETGASTAHGVARIADESGWYSDVQVLPDLANRDRFVIATLADR